MIYKITCPKCSKKGKREIKNIATYTFKCYYSNCEKSTKIHNKRTGELIKMELEK